MMLLFLNVVLARFQDNPKPTVTSTLLLSGALFDYLVCGTYKIIR